MHLHSFAGDAEPFLNGANHIRTLTSEFPGWYELLTLVRSRFYDLFPRPAIGGNGFSLPALNHSINSPACIGDIAHLVARGVSLLSMFSPSRWSTISGYISIEENR